MATTLDVIQFERDQIRRRAAAAARDIIDELTSLAERLEAGRSPNRVPLQSATRLTQDLGEIIALDRAVELITKSAPLPVPPETP